MADLKVEFPNPCSEPWEQMSPRGCNRHCATCDTIIHDLAALTIDEAEALLRTNEEVCVRAKIAPDGAIILASQSTTRRRMIASVTTGMALATAACQTVPATVSERFTISGTMSYPVWAQAAELRSSDGKKQRKTRKIGSGEFAFTNLRPGTYTLSIRESCGILRPVETITITDRSVVVSSDRPPPYGDEEEGCPIIVGVMRPADRPDRG